MGIRCCAMSVSSLLDIGETTVGWYVFAFSAINYSYPAIFIVGRSMGGRVAMCYTAKYPTDISACIIEDMDIRRRSVDSNYIQNFDEAKAIAFNRGHPTLNSLTRELESIGYLGIYSKWIDEGRIREDTSDGSKHKFWRASTQHFAHYAIALYSIRIVVQTRGARLPQICNGRSITATRRTLQNCI